MTSFRGYLAEHNHAAVRVGCILCAILMPAGVVLDLATHPEHTLEFLGLRLLASLLAFAILGISRLPGMDRYSYLLIVTLSLVCAGAIELMILRLEGARSPYYAGLNLLMLGEGLICLWTIRQTVLAVTLIIGIWLVPALGQTRDEHFYNNLYFLVLTGIIAVAANATRYNLARREHEARMALSQATAELQTSLERIRQLDQLKSQFFANISHELRTPLTLITAPLQELLHRGGLGRSVQDTLGIILRNALRLGRLIDGLFDLAQLEAGQMRLRVGSLDMRALTESVVAAFQPAADTMGLRLILDLDEGSYPATILGDADKLEVVLTNLLGNAVKFSERGGTIVVRLRADADGVTIQVIDDGPGIPEADQPYIFERFRRVESPGRKQGGAGIGLALVRELVELHGGTVSVRSRPGEGACFTLRLPVRGEQLAGGTSLGPAPSEGTKQPALGGVQPALLHTSLDSVRLPPPSAHEPAPSPTAEPAQPPGRPRAHILVAEDNEDLRRFLQDLLSPHYCVETVPDGRAALEAVGRRLPDLLLCDVMMPHLSGTELCLRLRQDPRTRALPIILLTARGGVDDTVEGFAHGADDYLVKPFSPRELMSRIRVQLKLRQLAAQVAHHARLAAVGTLAAGVAHEIKNPLNAIRTATATLRRQPNGPHCGELLDLIEECVGRIIDIAAALTDHARPADGEELSLCDLQAGLESALRLLAERLRQDRIEVVRDYRSGRQVLGRPRQLNQVLLNLIDNALRASPPGGRIFLGLEDLDEEHILVRVRDEGPGIPAEDQERIFDAFYTTRPPGEGTGLGLYLSRQIVDAHGGALRVISHAGQGAEFQVELPVQLAHSQRQGLAA
ncbi:MAG: ATP-binding protein [Myxococcales bacterium]|nr:ATP-binding protein [Myxococcota bacterium]MDW8283153.1 ATP-binding protein [Myxococcales bacterium]